MSVTFFTDCSQLADNSVHILSINYYYRVTAHGFRENFARIGLIHWIFVDDSKILFVQLGKLFKNNIPGHCFCLFSDNMDQRPPTHPIELLR